MAPTEGSRRLVIVIADDVGQHEGTIEGVLRAHRDGVVTDASVQATGAAFEQAVQALKGVPTLGVGVHLTVTGARPLLSRAEIPSIVGADGAFAPSAGRLLARLASGLASPDAVRREWLAQVRAVREAGLVPTHLTSHEHVHLWPSLWRVVVDLARRERIPYVRTVPRPSAVREALSRPSAVADLGGTLRCLAVASVAPRKKALPEAPPVLPDQFHGLRRSGRLEAAHLRAAAAELVEGVNEWMCHPGDADGGGGAYQTRAETDALCDASVREAVTAAGGRFVSARELLKP